MLTLRVAPTEVDADVRVDRRPGHESLGVVVPWSTRRFQYTVKDDRPAGARARSSSEGRRATCSARTRGRCSTTAAGRWPYRISWNWGSGSGRLADGRVVGVQVGGAWTDGTGCTENALIVDGRLHKIGEELRLDVRPRGLAAAVAGRRRRGPAGST